MSKPRRSSSSNSRALELIRRHDPARILTLGGECAVSVAPFSELARRYGDDLAIVWIDAHPDVGTAYVCNCELRQLVRCLATP